MDFRTASAEQTKLKQIHSVLWLLLNDPQKFGRGGFRVQQLKLLLFSK